MYSDRFCHHEPSMAVRHTLWLKVSAGSSVCLNFEDAGHRRVIADFILGKDGIVWAT